MSFLGKGVNKFFTSLGSLLKKIVELTFNSLGFIKFKISKKSYNVREESSRKGKIAGRKVKNNMDKFAIKAQVATDKGLILLGKFLRLLTFGILKLFNSISRGLYNASEKSKDKFTSYNVSQDEKNKEKFLEFDNLIAKCNDIENYEEAAASNYENEISINLEDTILNNTSNNSKELNYSNDKNIQNKINKEDSYTLDKTLHENTNTYDNNEDDDVKEYHKEEKSISDLDYTLYGDINSYGLNNEGDTDIKKFVLNKHNINETKNDTSYSNDDLDKTLLEDSNFSDSIKLSSKQYNENTISNKDVNVFNKNTTSKDNDEVYYYEDENEDDYDEADEDTDENESHKKIFDFLKKKDKNSFDETFHGEDYEFNSSIKLANENYSKNKNIEPNPSKIENPNLISKKEDDSDKTQMINKDDFREALNSKLQPQYNNKARTYKSSLDDDDESIKRFLSDDE